MEPNLAAVLGLGALLGARHALDPDHVVAVSTLVSQTRGLTAAARLGFVWGLGHTLTLLLAGLPVVAFRLRVPEGAASLEGAVAVMLVVLGGLTLRDHLRKKVHVHVHEHGGSVHAHFHRHDAAADHRHSHAVRAGLKPFVIGMVHGLAGSAALALLVLATIRSPWLAAAYILVFGLGSALAMAGVTLGLALPFLWAGGRLPQLGRAMRLAAGAASVALGVSIARGLM